MDFSKAVQQRAFLRTMNYTAFKEISKIVQELSSIKSAVGFIGDLIRQGVFALKLETAVPPKSECARTLHDVGTSLFINLVDAQDKWKGWMNQVPTSMILNDSLTTSDVELLLVGKFFSAQTVGSRLRSHFRELIRNVSGGK